MSYFRKQIDKFLENNQRFKKVLEKIIHIMIEKCRYINGESLERHNWGERPIKLKNIPEYVNSPTFYCDLIKALNSKENQQSIIELVWGDIQLGKRVHACIIMWFSVHILKRPVLYMFRNLQIDQKQLQDDITGTESYNFNIQYIKSVFEEFNAELFNKDLQYEDAERKGYNLPDLKDITNIENLNKLSSKDAMNPTDIFCCLINYAQLEKIRDKFSEYICFYKELVDITLIVDESDLICPTSSNDRKNKNDEKDTTKCEKLIAYIYKKVRYSLLITGTAHSLLYNVTTRLTDEIDVKNKISKVHKMIRTSDYYGIVNDSICFNTNVVNPWWNNRVTINSKKKISYDIIRDYDINIKKIIEQILERPTVNYDSLIINEEKYKTNQISLVDIIINDFPELFIVIFHGQYLRLYLSKKYEEEIKNWSKWDSEKSSTRRLWQTGGVYKYSIDTENSESLPNNYCYFNIDTKKLNIKFVYKLLRILFENSVVPITHKTIITITGKYGDRGYSFTSDDYGKYSLHLTDQYFVSHASYNCTNDNQVFRIQGKYPDAELENGTMKLTLWTTPELQDIMQNFYVKFIKLIEPKIMDCENWEEIKNLMEGIIYYGQMNFSKYMNYLDVSKKRKNIKPMRQRYDKKMCGFPLIYIYDMCDTEIGDYIKNDTTLPPYICINDIKDDLTIEEFIEKYGEMGNNKIKFENLEEEVSLQYINSVIDKFNIKNELKLNHVTQDWMDERLNHKLGDTWYDLTREKWKKFTENDIMNDSNAGLSDKKNSRRIHLCYDENDNLKLCIKYWSDTKQKQLPKKSVDYHKQMPYIIQGNKVKYSVLKDLLLPTGPYYWKTIDDKLYLHDLNKREIISINIISPLHTVTDYIQTNTTNEPFDDVLLFTQACCKPTDQTNLRFGIADIYNIYKTWCKINGNKAKVKLQKLFKIEFEKLNYKIKESKGVDIDNHPGKRGYHIMVSL